MVRFSDLLGNGDDDDDESRRDVTPTPTEPVPPPPAEPPPPPPQAPSSGNDLLDRLTTYSSSRPATQEQPQDQEPEQDQSRFGLPAELLETQHYEPGRPEPANDAGYAETLAPVDDDLLPRRRGRAS
jgi:hypothetical protein